jgi:hypothetical protein
VLPHTRRRWAFRGVGFWRRVGGSTVFCVVLFFFIFLVKTAFLLRFDFYTPSVFLPILTTFYQIFLEISFRFTSGRLLPPSVFLPILTTFCQILLGISL